MEIKIPKDVLGELEKASEEMGLNEKELVARAVRLYLRNIKEQENLSEEMDAWERAAIKDSRF